MNDINKQKIELLNIQMRNSMVAIVTIIVFIILSYNKKLSLMGQKPYIDVDKMSDIITNNRIAILVAAVISVYLNYQSYKISKEMENELVAHVAYMEYVVSYLPLLQIIILVYIAFRYFDEIEGADIGPIII